MSEITDDLNRRASRRLPGGVDSNVRLDAPRLFFARGEGAWLWDVDGKDYVDYLLGQGPNFLGHAHPAVTAAVAAACAMGTLYGGQHVLEVEAAERLCEILEWPDMVRLGSSGTEMVQAALRLARAATGRRRFVRFAGHYHGWLDNVLIKAGAGALPGSAGQVSGYLLDSDVLPWNDAEALALHLAEHGEEIAAVIMEPVMFNSGSIPPRPGYLEAVRDLCSRYGAVLIFDEVISGFRVALNGAAGRFGVTPDLAVYGKAMAGGWPVAAVAGREEMMQRFGTAEVNHSGTFNGSVMAAAAVVATLKCLSDDPPYERIEAHGRAIQAGLVEAGARHGLPLRTQGLGMAFHASLGEPGLMYDFADFAEFDAGGYAALTIELANAGVWLARRGIWYVSAAHGERESTALLERADAAMRRFASARTV